MSTLQRLFFGGCPAYCNGLSTNGTNPIGETNNDPATGLSRGLVFLARKPCIITDIAVHNRYTSDVLLIIAQTPGGVYYQQGVTGHHRRTDDVGVTIPAGVSYDAMVGRRYSLGTSGPEGLILLTNIAIPGLSALTIDVIGETN